MRSNPHYFLGWFLVVVVVVIIIVVVVFIFVAVNIGFRYGASIGIIVVDVYVVVIVVAPLIVADPIIFSCDQKMFILGSWRLMLNFCGGVGAFWYPTELSHIKALGKVVAVNPWKVWEECTDRRKQATGNLIHQTSHWQFNSLLGDCISNL